jgi:glucose/arabinose dehydrogenase
VSHRLVTHCLGDASESVSMTSRRTFLVTSAGLAAALAGCSTSQPAPPSGPTRPSPVESPVDTPTASPSPSRASTPSNSPRPTRTPTPEPTPEGPPDDPRVAGVIADNLNVPWGIAFLKSGDALVSERDTGRILRIARNGKKTSLGEVDGVVPPNGLGEGGLMGIALAPGDDETLFVYHTARSDDRLVRVSLAGGKVGRSRRLLTGIPTSVHHHGGRLLFAPDRSLFLSTGDAENSESAQDRDALTGKILRLDADGSAASGNPFDNRTWSYGHRNIEGLALDARGRLWATEFGAQETDELNLIRRGGNYGWPNVEGRTQGDRYVQPRYTWSPTSTSSPAGLAITRSTAYVAALRGQCLFSLRLDGTRARRSGKHLTEKYGRIRNVVVAPDGALWVTTSNTDGRTEPGNDDDQILRVTI